MGIFFKSTVTDEKASNVFFITLLKVFRDNSNKPNFEAAFVLDHFNQLLAVNNEKPANHHISSIRACCSLLQLETASKDFIDIIKRANKASLSNNSTDYLLEFNKGQDWLGNHGVSLIQAPTMDQILSSLRGK